MERLPYGIRVQSEGQFSRFSTSEPRGWELLVTTQTAFSVFDEVRAQSLEGGLPRQLEFTRVDEKARNLFQQFYGLERKLEGVNQSSSMPDDYPKRRNVLFRSLARDLKRRGYFSVFPQMLDVVGASEMPQHIQNIFTLDIATLYFLVCQPTRFLVGTKDGIYWKNVRFPVQPEENKSIPLLDIALPYLAHLNLIGRRELVAVPESPMGREDLKALTLPEPAKSVEELLEDSFYRQRYIVSPEGAEIRFRKAGDLRGAILVHSGNELLSRVLTTRGDVFVRINLDSATWFSPDIYSDPTKQTWAAIVAETYHDLVTADEISTIHHKSLRPPRPPVIGSTLVPEDIDPQIIYIPRKVKVGQPIEPRLPYTGPSRPVQPHKVEGYRRRGNMTEEHRKELYKFEARIGLKKGAIVDKIPAGHTWVRPHVSPLYSEDEIAGTPIYIKRRIETQIQEKLNLPPRM